MSDTNWAYQQRGLSANEKLVLIYIAQWCGPDRACWASKKKIALMCDISTRTVQRAIKSLCEKGLIKSTAEFWPDGSQKTNNYTTMASQGVIALSPRGDTQMSPGGDRYESPTGDARVSAHKLQNKNNLKDIVPEPSPAIGLIYSEMISEKSIGSIEKILLQLPNGLSNTMAQPILDELAGAISQGFVTGSPERYFWGIVKNYRTGNFKPSLGIEIANQRRKTARQNRKIISDEDVESVKQSDKSVGQEALASLFHKSRRNRK